MLAVFASGIPRLLPRLTLTAQAVVLPADSGQCHWLNHNTGIIEHVHNDNALASRYPDVAGPFRVNFTTLLFHTSGFIGNIFAGNQKTSDAQDTLFFDDTMGSRFPVMQGVPDNVAQWSGHYTVSPAVLNAANHPVPFLHGWAKTNSVAYAYFPDGATVKALIYEPYHSVVDTSVPEVPGNQDRYVMAECNVDSNGSGNSYGQQVVTIESVLPDTSVVGLSARYRLQFSTYNYANNFDLSKTIDSVTDVIVDPDFHHCIIAPINPQCGGTATLGTWVSAKAGDLVSRAVWLDPAMMGPAGVHKIAVRRCTPNNGDTLCTLMVFSIRTAVGGPVGVPELPPDQPPVDMMPPMQPPPPPAPVTTVSDSPAFVRETRVDGVLKTAELCYGSASAPTCKAW